MTTGVLWCLDFDLLFVVWVVNVVGGGELVLMVVVREDESVLVVEDKGCVELEVELGVKVEVGFEEVVEVAGVELKDLGVELDSDELL